MVQNEGKITVPRLRVTPVHGCVLVKDAHSIPILPEHIDMFNQYLELAFRQGLLPSRDGFYKACADYYRVSGQRYPVITSTPDTATIPPLPTAGAAVLDSDIFWRKLFAEQYRRDRPWLAFPPKLDFSNSLWVAVVVIETSRGHTAGYYWTGTRPSHYHDFDEIFPTGPADHDMGLETCRGFLQIRSGPFGLYFDMVLMNVDEAGRAEADLLRELDDAEN